MKTLVTMARFTGWSAMAVLFLVPNLGHSLSILQNGDFSNGMENWSTPETLHWWNPLTPGNTASLEPPDWDYRGMVLRQPLHVAVSGGQTVTGTFNVIPTNPNTFENSHLILLHIWSPGEGHQVLRLGEIGDDADDPGETMILTPPPMVLPAGTTLLTGLSIHQINWGGYKLGSAELILSGDGTVHPVPEVDAISPVNGEHGVEVTVFGSGFGETGEIRIGGSPDGVIIQSWTDVEITAVLREPVRSGFVSVWRDGLIESTGLAAFSLDSPTFQIRTGSGYRNAFVGETIKAGFALDFFNGYTPSPAGLTLRALDGEGAPAAYASLNQENVSHPGGYALTVETAGLSTGPHRIYLEAVDNVPDGAQRKTPVDFTLHSVNDCAISYSIGYETYLLKDDLIEINHQGSINLWFQFTPDDSDWPGSWNVGTVTSDNPQVVLPIYIGKPWDYYSFYALRNGTANLTFTGPDGFARVVQITVAFPESPKILEFSVSPRVVTNSGEDTVTHYGRATHTISIGTSGTGAWDFSDPANYPVWSDGNSQVMRSATVWQEAELGTSVLTLGTDDGTHRASVGLPLTVINAPVFSGILATPVSLKQETHHTEISTIAMFAPGQSPEDEPAHSLWIHSHGESVQLGAIPPGDYRVRYDTWDGPGVWHDNAPDWTTTAPVSFAAGAEIELDMVYLGGAVSFEKGTMRVPENATEITLSLRRTALLDEEWSVQCTLRPLTAVPGLDYTGPTDPHEAIPLTFEAGSAIAEWKIPVNAGSSSRPRTFLASIQDAGPWGVEPVEPRTVLVTLASVGLPCGTYASWASGIDWQGKSADPQDDANGNGLSNFLSYALGLDPVDPVAARALRVLPSGEGQWGVSFQRERSTLIYIVETSTDLLNWTPAATNPGIPGEEVQVSLPNSGLLLFARLRVSEP